MVGIPDIAVGAIVAALIAGLVSLLGLIVSKEQKISEFRQAWIDALRSEIACLISHANAIYSAGAAGFSSSSELWKSVGPDFFGMNQAASSIQLRVNPTEAQSLLKLIGELDALFAIGRPLDHQQISEVERRLVDEARVILKKEWLRVRDGEQVYRIARAAALAVLAACLLALVVFSLLRVASP